MANIKKHRVNPYLFVLLKRLLEYDVCGGISERPNKQQVAQFIYARWSTKAFRKTTLTSQKELRDPVATRISESIRRDLFSPTEFEFSEAKLDQLAKEITILDQVSSWNDFVKKYAGDIGAVIAERDFMYASFSELNSDSQQAIFTWVEKKLLKLHLEFIRNDKTNSHRIIRSTEEFVIRTINKKEIHDLIAFKMPLPSTSVNSKEHSQTAPWYVEDETSRMKRLFNKNPNIFYIYKDDYDLWGFISAFPIKEESRRRLEDGEYELMLNDIYSSEEKGEVQYVYVEDVIAKHTSIRNLLLKDLRSVVSGVANLENVTLVFTSKQASYIKPFCERNNIKYFDVNAREADLKEKMSDNSFTIEVEVSLIKKNQ